MFLQYNFERVIWIQNKNKLQEIRGSNKYSHFAFLSKSNLQSLSSLANIDFTLPCKLLP